MPVGGPWPELTWADAPIDPTSGSNLGAQPIEVLEALFGSVDLCRDEGAAGRVDGPAVYLGGMPVHGRIGQRRPWRSQDGTTRPSMAPAITSGAVIPLLSGRPGN